MNALSAPPFLGQSIDPYTSSILPATIASIVLLIFLFIGLAVLFMSLRHARRSREMLHKEPLQMLNSRKNRH